MNIAVAFARWRHRPRRQRGPADPLAAQRAEIAAAQAHVDRLAAAARAGDLEAAALLTDLAEDHVGQARRRIAQVASAELYACHSARREC